MKPKYVLRARIRLYGEPTWKTVAELPLYNLAAPRNQRITMNFRKLVYASFPSEPGERTEFRFDIEKP